MPFYYLVCQESGMLLFFTNNVSLSPGCRFAVSLFQRITSLMFTPWRLAMLESESPLRTRYVMLSLLFASRCALLPAPIVKLWPGFSLDPRSLFHCCKSLVLTSVLSPEGQAANHQTLYNSDSRSADDMPFHFFGPSDRS